MLRLYLVLLLIPLSAAKSKFQRQNQHFEGATNETVVMAHPAYIKAAKMHRLIKRQDVVSTCRYILFKEKKNYTDAKEACHTLEWPFTHKGAWLADIHTTEENHDFRILLQLAFGVRQTGGDYNRDNWVWIGAEKTLNNNKRLPSAQRGVYNATEWEWLDGTHPNFTNWMRGMPDQMRRGGRFQNHVMVNKRGYWDDTFSHLEAPYACNYCGRYIVIKSHVTWWRANHSCKSYGLEFAIVNSPNDHLEFGMAVNATFGPGHETPRWNNTNWIWLGTQEKMQDGVGTGVWEHVDGTPLGWSPKWDRKVQPDNWTLPRGEQSAVAYSRINKKWDDSYMWKKRPFACMCLHRSCSYDAKFKGESAGGE